jgi:citrate lyase beta subunit
MIRPRRAPLFTPGDSERKIAKGAAAGADAVVLDLEDGVALGRKAEARATVRKALEEIEFQATERLVRINPVGTGLETEDLAEVLGGRPDGVVVPKTESGAQLHSLAQHLAREERARGWPEGSLRIIALVETAPGVARLPEIAGGGEGRLDALIFGAEDYAASIGATRTPEGMEVLYARSAVVTFAAAHGLQAIDTLWTDFQDDEGLRRDALFARQLGYVGKIAIHPRQVPIIHAAMTPSEAEIAHARCVLQMHDAQQAAGQGAFALDGKMVDMPMVRAALQVLARAGMKG